MSHWLRLELADFPVSDIRLGDRFFYDGGKLEVDRDALVESLLADERIETAALEVASPGDAVRITGVRDLVEPRAKVDGSGQVFPGVLGGVAPVGAGRTHRLSGMAVTVTAAYEGTIRAGTGVQRSAILDLWGPGAAASRFSALRHLVLVLRLREGLGEQAAHEAIQQAECRVGLQVAQATANLAPESVAVLASPSSENLPRVVLIQGCITHGQQPHSGVGYYGEPVRESLSTAVHPNELFDGAVTPDTTRGIGYYPTTWDWQNHPLAMGLYEQQAAGALNFAGVILERIAYENFHGKEMIALNTARLARMLDADAALITWLGSGNAFVDVMLTVRACEEAGIKTVLVTYEYGGKDGVDSPLLFYTPTANALVSTGSRDRWLELPRAEKIIGPYEEIKILSYPGALLTPAREALALDARDMVIGGVDIWGGGQWSCVGY